MRYLITGGAGYLGRHLTHSLVNQGHNVVIYDNFSNGEVKHLLTSADVINGDLSDQVLLQSTLKEFQVDGVFHLAAKKSVAESYLNPELYDLVNVGGTVSLVKACVETGIRRIVFTSSAAVYGALDTDTPIKEDSPMAPCNPYGSSKKAAEEVLKQYVKDFNLRVATLRVFNIGGAESLSFSEPHGENVIPLILKSIKGNQIFTIFGSNYPTHDGTCIRDFVHVNDVVSAHIMSMDYLESMPDPMFIPFNVSSNFGVSVKELISEFENVSKQQIQLKSGEPRNGDPASVIGDNTKISFQLKWTPKKSIKEIVHESLKYS
jgi:UDP-glucose 4-epimerase